MEAEEELSTGATWQTAGKWQRSEHSNDVHPPKAYSANLSPLLRLKYGCRHQPAYSRPTNEND